MDSPSGRRWQTISIFEDNFKWGLSATPRLLVSIQGHYSPAAYVDRRRWRAMLRPNNAVARMMIVEDSGTAAEDFPVSRRRSDYEPGLALPEKE
jgi:hypothetical protein